MEEIDCELRKVTKIIHAVVNQAKSEVAISDKANRFITKHKIDISRPIKQIIYTYTTTYDDEFDNIDYRDLEIIHFPNNVKIEDLTLKSQTQSINHKKEMYSHWGYTEFVYEKSNI